ncbi:MAG: hypothetical protein IPI65_10230 [Bacteroidetes bacterium]|nr:hypothetical protein [Bacteroidota bacterium]
MKKLLCILIPVILATGAQAQLEQSSFGATGRGGTATSFVTDYQALGINPANLGFQTKYAFSLGIAELGYGIYSEALVKDDVRAILFNNEDSITAAQSEMLAQAFLNEGIQFNVDVMAVGFSLRVPKFGTLAFSVTGHAAYNSKFDGEAANIIFEGYDYAGYFDTVIVTPTEIYGVAYEPLSLSELFGDSEFKFDVNTSFNFGYGLKLFGSEETISAYAGIGFKYILGYGYLDMHSDGSTITGISALGLDILDLEAGITSPITASAAEPVGRGTGWDFGFSVKVRDALTASASIVDIGKMKYTANVLQINDVVLDTVSFSGVTSTDPIQIISDMLNQQDLIEYSGLSEFEVSLPTKLRLGASLKINDLLDVGLDAVFPMNEVAGAIETPVIGVGAQLTLFEILNLSAGLSAGGGYAYNVPAGIGLDFKIWEIGVATRDALTWFGETSPNVSMAIGVLRFKI